MLARKVECLLWRRAVTQGLSASFSKKLQSWSEKQRIMKSTHRLDNKITELERSEQRVKTLHMDSPPKWPTRIFRYLHVPILSLSFYDAYQSGGFTLECLQSLLLDVNLLYFFYFSYYYLAVFQRNRLLAQENPVELYKRVAFTSFPAITYLMVSKFGLELQPVSIVLAGMGGIVTSFMVDFVVYRYDRKHIHEDFLAKNVACLLMTALLIAVMAFIAYQQMQHSRMEGMLGKYQVRSDMANNKYPDPKKIINDEK